MKAFVVHLNPIIQKPNANKLMNLFTVELLFLKHNITCTIIRAATNDYF